MLLSQGDLLLTILFGIGLFQLFWLSVVLVRKGFSPSLIRLSMVGLLSIWVLIWPAYEHTTTVFIAFSLFSFPLLFSLRKNHAFARHLRLCWHSPNQHITNQQLPPWIFLALSCAICTSLFHQAPELGIGLGLSLCLAWSAADIMDTLQFGPRLNIRINPKQTLFGHLLLIIITSLVCTWSLQLYHGADWQQFIIATLIVGFVASLLRALISQGWNMPVSILGMAIVLWLL